MICLFERSKVVFRPLTLDLDLDVRVPSLPATVCYFLYIASPLTLSEIRSMLPAGLTADLAPSLHRTTLQRLHPAAKTVAQLLIGSCSCDLVRDRLSDPIADERELRSRYREHKLSRNEIIKELERHRRRPTPRPKSSMEWADALAGFVGEHARNAGPTLYLLDFGPHSRETHPTSTADPVACSVREIRVSGSPWLIEGRPVLVS
jgi:hypothetical protein